MAGLLPLLLAALAAQAPSIPIYGTAIPVDGDTLRIGDSSFRLFGIDAPERDQTCFRNGSEWPCGIDSSLHLARLVAGKSVRCLPLGKDAYGRTLARCDVIGQELNQAMVESGYATAFRKYSNDYVAAEDRARSRKLGLFAGSFEPPEAYRARRKHRGSAPARSDPRPAARPAHSSQGCVIKGNHSRRGEWIYHLPGMPYYDQTRAEAMFCSEREAQAAGYRRARVR